MAKAKSKYTPEETLLLITAWGMSTDSGISTTGITIVELAAQFANKWNPRELRAKLSHEGHYKAKPKTKSGKVAIRKDALSTIIGELCEMAEPDASSLEKSNKTALELIINTINTLHEALAFYETAAEESDETTDEEKADVEAIAEAEAVAEAEAEAEEEEEEAEAEAEANADLDASEESDESGGDEPVTTA